MSESKRLAAHRAAKSEEFHPAPAQPAGPTGGDKPAASSEKDSKMDDEQKAALETAKKEAKAAGFKEANDRMSAVFGCDHYAGNEALAAKLLGKPNLAAEDIIDTLSTVAADKPKESKKHKETMSGEDNEDNEDDDDGGRDEMRKALADQRNSNIDANDDGGNTSKTSARDPWAPALADITNAAA